MSKQQGQAADDEIIGNRRQKRKRKGEIKPFELWAHYNKTDGFWFLWKKSDGWYKVNSYKTREQAEVVKEKREREGHHWLEFEIRVKDEQE